MAGAIVVGIDPPHRPAGAGFARRRKRRNGGRCFLSREFRVAAIVINIFASIDFNQNGSWIFVELINRMLYLCALLLGSLVVALRSLEKPQVDERAAPWILYGILVGVGVFLIHNLIEFSMFEPGPLCLFGVLMGSALGIRLANRPVRTPGIRAGGDCGIGGGMRGMGGGGILDRGSGDSRGSGRASWG